jgi:hypothetical protein
MKFKVGTTAYQRKTKTQRDVIVTIVIDETPPARVLGERAINDRSKESKVLRGIIRGGVHIFKAGRNDQCSLGRAMGSFGVWLQSLVD